MSDDKPVKAAGALDGLFDLVGDALEEIRKSKAQDPSRRPSEVWIRWRISPVGPNAIDLIGCSEKPLATPLGEGEHEGRFR